MFDRKIIENLREWKKKSNRKPLILRGARQVGKTTAIEIFSREFEHVIILNMEEPANRRLFNESLSFEERISAVMLSGSVPSDAENTLIFLDEIQACPEAVATLRYFHEMSPHVFVIAAGSLLETVIEMKAGFPVGRVEYLKMHPCSFREFLSAMGEKELLSLLDEIPFPDYAGVKASALFKEYILVGGMPEAVSVYAATKDIVRVNDVYDSLLASFIDDVEKYASDRFIRVVRHIVRTAFTEAGSRIKFQGFGSSTYSSKDVSEAFDLLQKAMLIKLIYPTTSYAIPVKTDLKKSPKLMLLDSGLLHYQAGLQKEIFVSETPEAVAYGRIVEHIIGQMIYSEITSPAGDIHFWVREKKQSSAEVDYIYQFRDKVIPIEVKSGAAGRLRSLHQFIDRADHSLGVRFCDSPVSIENVSTINGKKYRLLSLPWYLAGELKNYLEWFAG